MELGPDPGLLFKPPQRSGIAQNHGDRPCEVAGIMR